ncbi:3-alpha,7-alpha,12-alpha-trihydroxy-5-beta-cholest-24-enoyl-CoA hydratase [Parapusillimonas sp. SGNA-6]|nr:3-alpha,7-alpha,12-alpha-trihydroxy-5-beta-cholest-24-enoyl-CoA hydratase [Parapusillimonas sp. SGNA-6]
MAIDYARALALDIPDVHHSYTAKDAALYALGIGLGSDPIDAGQLTYVYEKNQKAFPTMAVIQGFVSFRDIALGIDYAQIVHAGQELILHSTIPVSGTVIGKTRVAEIVDRGEKGAMVYLDRDIRDTSGTLLASVRMSVLCRADGGFGGPVKALPPARPIPDRPPSLVYDIGTLPQQALIYRLSGDVNPLHADIDAARKAGFERPILHGLATFGIIGRAVVAARLDGDADRLRSLGGRFSAPVFPGETIRVELWDEGDDISIRASVKERDKVVFNNGHASFR